MKKLNAKKKYTQKTKILIGEACGVLQLFKTRKEKKKNTKRRKEKEKNA